MPLLYSDRRFLDHRTGWHPECPQRLETAVPYLEACGILAAYERPGWDAARPNLVGLVHHPEYIHEVEEFAALGGGSIEQDTVVSPASYEVALLAAGAAAAAVDAVLDGPHARAFCLVRPPGHHALPGRAMGFCLFNNAAVAAAHAVRNRGLRRVLVVDWDVHHGNGTQEIFYDSERVWFFSAHRFPFYPGTGREEETGTGAGLGSTFNLPLPANTPSREYHARFSRMLEDAVTRGQPDLIILSAGFDAHRADPIGGLNLETEDFARLTDLLVQAAESACRGRIVGLLEGGYNLQRLPESLRAHLERLQT